MNVCRLCKCEAELQKSHIIPKFIGGWIKDTSVTGFLRAVDTPNLRRQDLFKEKMLCKKCENIFSNYEKYFAETIFHPYMNSTNSTYNYSYDNRLSKFCASLSWRVLVYITENLNFKTNPDFEKAKIKFESFLLNESTNLDQYEQHIIPLEGGSDLPLYKKHSNFNSYFQRAIDTDLLQFKNGSMIYIKIPKFILLSNISYKKINKMRSSRVQLNKGEIIPKEYFFSSELYDYLDYRLDFVQKNITDIITDAQNEKILETVRKKT